MKASLGVFQILPATPLEREKVSEKIAEDPALNKTHKFEVDITVTSGVENTPWTFNLKVQSAYGLNLGTDTQGFLTLSRLVAAGADEFYRWLDENWTADLVIIMDNIRFIVKNCTAETLYYGPLDKADNQYLTESLEVKYDLILPSYRT